MRVYDDSCLYRAIGKVNGRVTFKVQVAAPSFTYAVDMVNAWNPKAAWDTRRAKSYNPEIPLLTLLPRNAGDNSVDTEPHGENYIGNDGI